MNAVRPSLDTAYSEWGAPDPTVEPRVEDGTGLVGRHTIRADACVIGTGAGGAPVAKELAEAGLSVVMLEEGRHHSTDAFTARPRDMTSLLYRDAGQTVTTGNVPILLPLGGAVGGTTLVNSGTCFRTPRRVLERWAGEFGLEELGEPELDPYFRRVERELNVAQVPARLAGRNAMVVKRGADALGWSSDFLFRNARGCVGSGVCAFGCPTGAKQHTGATYVPRAWAAGATTWTSCRAERIVLAGRRARGVEARTAAGGRLSVECSTVVVACGAIGTPLFLESNGLGRRSGQLGHNLAIHPATAVRALFDEEIDMARGVPQSFYIDEFAGEGIMFEGAAGPPDYLSMTFPFSGERHRDLMMRWPRLSQFGVMVSDSSRGSVRRRAGQVQIRYHLGQEDVRRFERGLALLGGLYRAAGAREVFLPLDPRASGRELRAGDLSLMAFHPLGTARAHADPARGVVGADLQLHGVEGIYVTDASVIPSSLGVNPQITIMALATRAACRLLGRPAPVGEPVPEAIA